jgi:hemoglobin-like flavoprotein
MMNPKQIRMVQQSFDQLLPHASEISARFYEHLFRIDPAMRSLFREDIPSQSRKFMAMLRITVKGIDRIEQIRPVLIDVGKRHHHYGVAYNQYAPMRDALLLAFQEEMALHEDIGVAFTPELRDAWIAAYDLLAEIMLEGQEIKRHETPVL